MSADAALLYVCDLMLRCRHGVEHPTLENGDCYLHPDDESELEPIRIKPSPYDDDMLNNSWMNDLDDLDLGSD